MAWLLRCTNMGCYSPLWRKWVPPKISTLKMSTPKNVNFPKCQLLKFIKKSYFIMYCNLSIWFTYRTFDQYQRNTLILVTCNQRSTLILVTRNQRNTLILVTHNGWFSMSPVRARAREWNFFPFFFFCLCKSVTKELCRGTV